ncbi:MAG: DoxX family protein [Mycobacterium sp.]|nr:DoxX family protein [Mycobacterium sp.]
MHALVWVAQISLALIFLASGFAKLTMSRERMLATGQTGAAAYPLPVVRFTAACELLAAVGLTLPPLVGIAEPLVGWAAVGLAIVMTGAMAMHSRLAVTEQRLKEWRNVAINVGLLVACLFVAVQWI